MLESKSDNSSSFAKSMKENSILLFELSEIAQVSIVKEQENEAFRAHLKSLDGEWVDEQVALLNDEIEPQIDCTQCGNCCKTLMINVTKEESARLANYLSISQSALEDKYVEKSEGSDRMIINTIPCHFLSENKCTVYPARFEGCREFPGLDKPMITKRLFTLYMHYDRCPIVFNVMEHLKVASGFNY